MACTDSASYTEQHPASVPVMWRGHAKPIDGGYAIASHVTTTASGTAKAVGTRTATADQNANTDNATKYGNISANIPR